MEYVIYTLGALFIVCQLLMLLCKIMIWQNEKAYSKRRSGRICEERVKQRLKTLGDELNKLQNNGRT